MHTGTGMVATTRRAFGEPVDRPGHNDLPHLTQSPADSLLRKLVRKLSPGTAENRASARATMYDRGGGCLACHIDEQSSQTHPALTAQVSDARCFGCHSRSGRISLNYAGLAETARPAAGTGALEDGRRVEFRPADRHHAAGMGCTDCHTEEDLMGTTTRTRRRIRNRPSTSAARTAIASRGPSAWSSGPQRYRTLQSRIPYPAGTATRFPVTAHGTPLWHVELQGDSAWLHRKLAGERVRIPPYRDSDHPLSQRAPTPDCTSCHGRGRRSVMDVTWIRPRLANNTIMRSSHNHGGYWKERRSDLRKRVAATGRKRRQPDRAGRCPA